MAISEFEIKKCERALAEFMNEHRPPAHVRDKLDFSYRISNQTVEIFEIRPYFKNPAEKIETSFAKATYVKAKKQWRLYWKRADLKWHSYESAPATKSIEEALTIISEDRDACFFG